MMEFNLDSELCRHWLSVTGCRLESPLLNCGHGMFVECLASGSADRYLLRLASHVDDQR
jgi:hypothetical protein